MDSRDYLYNFTEGKSLSTLIREAIPHCSRYAGLYHCAPLAQPGQSDRTKQTVCASSNLARGFPASLTNPFLPDYGAGISFFTNPPPTPLPAPILIIRG